MKHPEWISDDGRIRLVNADCLEVLPTLEAGSVDAIITDPPYGIRYASNWATCLDGTPRRNGASFGLDEIDLRWIEHAYRAMTEHAYLFCFTRWDVASTWKAGIERVGFKVVQRLVWDKCHWKMGDLRNYGSQVEDVLVAARGRPQMFPGGKGRRGNVFRYSSGFLPEGQFDHPTQKPVALIVDYVRDASRDGDLILDPFAGSFTTAVACIRTNRRCIAIEKERKYFDIGVERCKAEYARTALLDGACA